MGGGRLYDYLTWSMRLRQRDVMVVAKYDNASRNRHGKRDEGALLACIRVSIH